MRQRDNKCLWTQDQNILTEPTVLNGCIIVRIVLAGEIPLFFIKIFLGVNQ